MRKPRLRTALIGTGATLALVAGGIAAGAVALAQGGTVYKGCIEGTARTMEHVYTSANPPACPNGSTAATWNKVGQQGPPGPQGPSGVVSMTQYSPNDAAPVRGGSWGFLGAPPTLTFADAKTAAQVTATVDEATSGVVTGPPASGELGICYSYRASPLTDVSHIAYLWAGPVHVSAQTVSGVVGNLSAGSYRVGLCAENQSSSPNGLAVVTITLAETASGVTYAGPNAAPARQRGAG